MSHNDENRSLSCIFAQKLQVTLVKVLFSRVVFVALSKLHGQVLSMGQDGETKHLENFGFVQARLFLPYAFGTWADYLSYVDNNNNNETTTMT